MAELILLPYLQQWDGTDLALNLLAAPQASPLDPLLPGGPAFADANFTFEIRLVQGLGSLPVTGSPHTAVTEATTAPPQARPICQALAAALPIDPTVTAIDPRTAGRPAAEVRAARLPGRGRVRRRRQPVPAGRRQLPLRAEVGRACRHDAGEPAAAVRLGEGARRRPPPAAAVAGHRAGPGVHDHAAPRASSTAAAGSTSRSRSAATAPGCSACPAR